MRLSLVDPQDKELSVRKQVVLLDVPRSSYYYMPARETSENLELMRLIDREYTRHPFYETRRMQAWLKREGYEANRKRVQRLMRVMGLAGICPKRNLSKASMESLVYPYLLRGIEVRTL